MTSRNEIAFDVCGREITLNLSVFNMFGFVMLVAGIMMMLTAVANAGERGRPMQTFHAQQQHSYAPQQRVAPQQYRPQAQLQHQQYAAPQQRGVQQHAPQQYAAQPQVQHYGSQFLSQTRPQYTGQPRQMYQVPQYYRQNVGRPQGVPQQWGAPQQNQSSSSSSSSSLLSGIGGALSGLLGGDNDKSQSGQTTVIIQQPVIAWAPLPPAQGIAFVAPVVPRQAQQNYEVLSAPSTIIHSNESNEALAPAPVVPPVAQATPVDANPAILAMQKMLHEQGLYEGLVDGTMNDQTARGLVLYQAVMQSTARMTPDEAAAAEAAAPEEKTAAEVKAPVLAPATPVASIPAQQAQTIATPAEVKTSVPEVKAKEPATTQEVEEHILRIPTHPTTTGSANAEPPVPNAAPQANVTTDKLDHAAPHGPIATQGKSITSKKEVDV